MVFTGGDRQLCLAIEAIERVEHFPRAARRTSRSSKHDALVRLSAEEGGAMMVM